VPHPGPAPALAAAPALLDRRARLGVIAGRRPLLGEADEGLHVLLLEPDKLLQRDVNVNVEKQLRVLLEDHLLLPVLLPRGERDAADE